MEANQIAKIPNYIPYPAQSTLNSGGAAHIPAPSGTVLYNYNPYQLYQYNNQQSTTGNTDINAVMRKLAMPILSRGTGYTQMHGFKVPFLNTEAKLYQLDNEQAVVIIPKKGPTTIKTFVKVGSFNERKNRGMSHYIEHNLFNGSRGLAPNQFVEEVTGMGGLYNASTDTADTDYFIKSPLHKEGDLEKFLTMHADMLLYPSFTPEMLEKERGPVISEIQMYQDDPYDKAYNTMIKNLFGIKADYQGLIAGSSKIIKNVQRQDVVNYYNEWYRPDNMLTVIVGDVDPDKTINLVSKLFNQKKASPQEVNKQHFNEPLNLVQKTVREDISSSHIKAVMTTIGFAGPENNNIKDTVATMGLLSALVGHQNARLTKAMKPFNSDAAGDMAVLSSDFNAPQLLEIDTNFTPGQEEEGLKAMYSVLHGMKQQSLTQQEMFVVKNKLKDNLTQMSESSMGIANLVGSAVAGHGDIRAYTDIVKHVDNLTPQDIQNAAIKYLNLNRASIVMIHPENAQSGAAKAKKIGFSGNHDKFKLNHVKEYNLPNNLHVVINDDPASIRTSANLKIRTDDIKTLKPGVSDILSLMLMKGTKNYSEDQLNQIIDTYNLGIGAGTEGDSINMAANCPKEMLPLSLRVMKEILYNSDLTQEKFNKAKEEIKLQYSSVPKDPGDRALEILYPDNNWGVTPRKVLEQIDNVTLQDVQNLHQQLIYDSQGTIAIDGPISQTPGLGNSIFTELQAGIGFNKPFHADAAPDSKPLVKNIVITETEDRDQADIVQVFKIKESGNIKDHAALLLLDEILGGNSMSRLFTDLRESQKLAYRVRSSYSTDGKHGNLALSIKTTTEDDLKGAKYDNLKKSLDGFRKHINKLINEPVSPKELETGKLEVKTDLSDSLEYSAGRSGRLQSGFNTLYGSQYNDALFDAVEQVTPQDLQNAANLYLSQPSVISLIASSDTISNMKPYLASLGNLNEIRS